MAFGIYKQGQGYWTRVMTAIGIGTLGLAGAQWAWQQSAVLDTPFEVIYLQASVAGVIALITAMLAYWVVGLNRRAVDFFIATEGEMRKVAWPPRKELTGSTWVVIGVSVLIALILFVSDLFFATIFRLLDVIQT
ncbi:MAG: preprotein translocase subunit SecE [Planctomycetota bacterium]|nr:MAG: preprotein translocase subunit SecE [Planctomycetota bacterium]